MRAKYTGFKQVGMSPYLEVHQALRAHDSDGRRPDLLAYASVARMNPYQALLYRSFEHHGFAVAPMLKPFALRDLMLHKPRTSSVTLHLHWVNWVLDGEADPEAAAKRVTGLLGRIDRYKKLGGKLVWTAHNVYPHGAKCLEAELALQQGIADRADVIHVMADSTLEVLSEYTRLDPERLLTAPHPNYRGAYEDVTSRSEARAVLGIDADETVFLLFGALKAYKGLRRTLAGFERLLADEQGGHRYRLLVAGGADQDPEVQEFVERALVHERVLIEPTAIPGGKLQYYLRAADAGLVTYTRSLNSGAALLYQTFGLPVLATDTAVLRETLPPESAVFLPVGSDDAAAYAAGLRQAAALAQRSRGSEVLGRIEDLAPETVSSKFAVGLRERLGLKSL